MLSQAVGYAATALGFLAGAGAKSCLVKDIAEACGIPAPYLAKIVHTLSKAGIVTTQRGIGGGVSLARPAAEVSLWQLCVAMNDPIIHPRCMLGTAECSDSRACPAHTFWTRCRGEQEEFLKNTSLADISAFETRRRLTALVAKAPTPEFGGVEVSTGLGPAS